MALENSTLTQNADCSASSRLSTVAKDMQEAVVEIAERAILARPAAYGANRVSRCLRLDYPHTPACGEIRGLWRRASPNFAGAEIPQDSGIGRTLACRDEARALEAMVEAARASQPIGNAVDHREGMTETDVEDCSCGAGGGTGPASEEGAALLAET